MATKPLNANQLSILAAIREYQATTGFGPSYAELSFKTGVRNMQRAIAALVNRKALGWRMEGHNRIYEILADH